ncbi:hypothetical protein [Mesorhizobium sp. WSM4906]|uniref:hypothetical protein n=1 Tax=Mesorhizobium sp. WSM4906 TaxID=3038546 RepID=UPI002417F7CD|nr:hypothetical protein [Mesorhizobium sp. WSM4906]WFP77647.1 hypothetical protein QAZ22_07620 [Mesorhizobium sp. WSM4906]
MISLHASQEYRLRRMAACWFHHTAAELLGRADALGACRVESHLLQAALRFVETCTGQRDKLACNMNEVKANEPPSISPKRKRGRRHAFFFVGFLRSVGRRNDEFSAILDALPRARSRKAARTR